MAQIEFFSTIEDEIKLISAISKDNSIKYSLVENNRLTGWSDIKHLVLPGSDTKFKICIWKSDLGELEWLTKEPEIDSSSHSRLVKSVFTREYWKKEVEQSEFNKMIDDEKSPILYYQRGEIIYDFQLPNIIISPQSSADRVSKDFKRWFNRIVSWIRRNGGMVYNWKMAEPKFRNDSSLLNTIYALSNAKNLIDIDKHNFAISINSRKFEK